MVNSVELMQLCRLCLVKDEVNIPIFDNETDVQQIFLKISTCLPVKVTQDDNLPKKICNDCSYKLDLCYQFWNTSANSEKQLVTWLNEVGLSQETLNEAKLQKTESNSTPGLVLKQETIEPESESSHEVVNNVSTESQEYILQQQQLPYQTPAFPFTDDNFVSGESANAGASKTHTNNKRESTLKRKRQAVATVTQPDSDDDVDEDIDDPTETKVAKTEETSDDDRDDDGLNDEESTEFAGVPSTSTDNEQPGPSGIGKNVVDAPIRLQGAERFCSVSMETPDWNEDNVKVYIKKEIDSVDVLKEKLKQCPDYTEQFDDKDIVFVNVETNQLNIKKENEEGVELLPLTNADNFFHNAPIGMSQEEANLAMWPNHEDTKPSKKLYYCHHCENPIKMTKEELIDHCKSVGIKCETQKFFRKAMVKNPRIKPCPRFYCEICSSEFQTKEEREKHSKETHKNHYVCEVCNAGFEKIVEYIYHMKTHSDDNLFRCAICPYTTSKRQFVTRHLQSSHDQFKKYVCELCDKSFYSYPHFLEHENIHTGEKPFQCNDCGKTFAYSRYLKSHERHVHKQRKEKVFKCPLCDKVCRTSQSLLSHRNTNHPEHLHVCDVCGKTFKTTTRLKLHTNIHLNKKPYQCSICNKRFNKRSIMMQHQPIHTGEKPYACTYCDQRFSRRDSMIIHSRRHTGEKPYNCQLCNGNFTTKKILINHQKKCTGSPSPTPSQND
ncbi:zinc finger and SCAN domain-containing protein 2 isoform X6 [Agrilus planipennis]|uniref:Zinc finger and SCAN domain-containing protein 2 isoform X6 n=1 Tax=Agrilus planipennis TaxID=224129 RepID=A0A7F5R9A6_AGRPL|nr:zinc finger and SCAN domain-containing protein 2 isoform X6 [Agrilus planipennis]